METTTGMSAPPMGMMISTPIAKASNVSSQNAACDSVRQNHTTSTTIDTPRAALRRCCPGEYDWAAGDKPLQLGERHHRSGKRDRADACADGHLDEARGADGAHRADPVRIRRIQGCGRDQDRGEPDEAVERGDELRHGGHRDLSGDDRAGAPSNSRRQARSDPT